MDRRRFLAALAGGLAATAGCASDEPARTASPGTEPSPAASPGTVYAGPTVTARPPRRSTVPPTTTRDGTASDDGGSPGGGAGGGGPSGASAPSGPSGPTPTLTPAESETSSPLRLTLSTVTMQRVAGEMTCTAGPLAWMRLDIGFLQGGEPVESERLSRDAPGTGDTLAFDVESEEPDLDGVQLTTAYAYPSS